MKIVRVSSGIAYIRLLEHHNWYYIYISIPAYNRPRDHGLSGSHFMSLKAMTTVTSAVDNAKQKKNLYLTFKFRSCLDLSIAPVSLRTRSS